MALSRLKKREPTFLELYFSPREVEIEPVLEDLTKVGVFDSESDGRRVLFGWSAVKPFGYKHIIVDLKAVLEGKKGGEEGLDALIKMLKDWVENYNILFAYNVVYDMGVLLLPFEKEIPHRNVFENVTVGVRYVLSHKDYKVVVERKKLFYVISLYENNELLGRTAVYDLMVYFSSSLKEAYDKFKDYIPEEYRLSDGDYQQWLKDKEERGKINDVSKVVNYNLLDVKVTAGLVHALKEIYDNKIAEIMGRNFKVSYTLPRLGLYAVTDGDLNVVKYPQEVLAGTDKAELYTALALSYRGGFFNSNALGEFRKVYKYDVNSMYPFFMSQVPRLEYIGADTRPEWGTFDLVCGFFANNTAVPIKIMNQSVVTQTTWGCFWGFEIEPKLLAEHLALDGISMPNPYPALRPLKVVKVFRFKYSPNVLPFRYAVREMYRLRKEFKAEGSPLEKSIKIIMNSSYGKFGELRFINPANERLEVASLITAMGRVYINSVLPREEVVTYLTDSIVAKRPLPSDVVGEELGQFKDETPQDYEVFLNYNNGIYAFMGGTEEVFHTRGFSPHDNNSKRPYYFARKFFTQYRKLLRQVRTPYEIVLPAKKFVMVKSQETIEFDDRKEIVPILGLLKTTEVDVRGVNSKMVYAPFNAEYQSWGKIIPTPFHAVLWKVFVDKGVRKMVFHSHIEPLRSNEIYLDESTLDLFKGRTSAWNLMKVLYGEDHELQRDFISDDEHYVLLFKPPRNLIAFMAYWSFVKPPFRLFKAKGKQAQIPTELINIEYYFPEAEEIPIAEEEKVKPSEEVTTPEEEKVSEEEEEYQSLLDKIEEEDVDDLTNSPSE